MRSIEDAIAWRLAHPTVKAGYCLRDTREAYGIAADGNDSNGDGVIDGIGALQAWASCRFKHPQSTTAGIPRGAPIWFTSPTPNGKKYGHVAIYLGNDLMLTAVKTTMKAASVSGWGKAGYGLLGWSEDINDVRLPELIPTPPPAPAPVPVPAPLPESAPVVPPSDESPQEPAPEPQAPPEDSTTPVVTPPPDVTPGSPQEAPLRDLWAELARRLPKEVTVALKALIFAVGRWAGSTWNVQTRRLVPIAVGAFLVWAAPLIEWLDGVGIHITDEHEAAATAVIVGFVAGLWGTIAHTLEESKKKPTLAHIGTAMLGGASTKVSA